MTLRGILPRARYLALIFPAFALFSALQIACGSSGSTGSAADDLSHEDDVNGGYGYAYRYGYGGK
jgi:hypothetical protein